MAQLFKHMTFGFGLSDFMGVEIEPGDVVQVSLLHAQQGVYFCPSSHSHALLNFLK